LRAEVAERSTLAVATLAKLRVLGGGPPFIKLGARVVYDAADVDAWIAAKGKRHSTADAPRAARRMSAPTDRP
jgi:predicted DNA-binding transcriptional regulator AlpA